MNAKPIGIFDSGMGGLTVMRALAARLPGESFVYLGDTARLPYGTKSAETVRRYSVQASRALVERGVKLVVVACNTASVSLPALEEALAPLPVIGVILPGAEAAVAAAPEGPIAVIATEGTVNGGAYVKAIRARVPGAAIVQQACPLFVPMTEEGLIEGPIVEAVAHRYLDPLLSGMSRPRCLLLGCTHYPVLKPVIAKLAPDVALVDSAVTTADAVARSLRDANLANDGAIVPPRFLVTDAPNRFARVGEIFFGRAIDPKAVDLIDLQ
jgi:glutamate racemase